MRTVVRRFEKVTWPGLRTGKCKGCGKSTRRERQFSQTVNPFNKNPETGRPKTFRMIEKEVREAARAWSAQPPVCTKCELSGVRDSTEVSDD